MHPSFLDHHAFLLLINFARVRPLVIMLGLSVEYFLNYVSNWLGNGQDVPKQSLCMVASLIRWNGDYYFITLLFPKHVFKYVIYHFLLFQRAGGLDLSISPLPGKFSLYQFKTVGLPWNSFFLRTGLVKENRDTRVYFQKLLFPTLPLPEVEDDVSLIFTVRTWWGPRK